MTATDTVYVVDDDGDVRESLTALLEAEGFRVMAFESAAAFLAAIPPAPNGCIVADIRMPGMDGLALQAELNRRDVTMPLIFVTGHGDVALAVQAMKAGAIEFFEKPYTDTVLIAGIRRALDLAHRREHRDAFARSARERIATLTAREREVMELLVDGAANKMVAFKLAISERTVEVHRARIMDKMKAKSVSDLVRAALIGVNDQPTGNP